MDDKSEKCINCSRAIYFGSDFCSTCDGAICERCYWAQTGCIKCKEKEEKDRRNKPPEGKEYYKIIECRDCKKKEIAKTYNEFHKNIALKWNICYLCNYTNTKNSTLCSFCSIRVCSDGKVFCSFHKNSWCDKCKDGKGKCIH